MKHHNFDHCEQVPNNKGQESEKEPRPVGSCFEGELTLALARRVLNN